MINRQNIILIINNSLKSIENIISNNFIYEILSNDIKFLNSKLFILFLFFKLSQ